MINGNMCFFPAMLAVFTSLQVLPECDCGSCNDIFNDLTSKLNSCLQKYTTCYVPKCAQCIADMCNDCIKILQSIKCMIEHPPTVTSGECNVSNYTETMRPFAFTIFVTSCQGSVSLNICCNATSVQSSAASRSFSCKQIIGDACAILQYICTLDTTGMTTSLETTAEITTHSITSPVSTTPILNTTGNGTISTTAAIVVGVLVAIIVIAAVIVIVVACWYSRSRASRKRASLKEITALQNSQTSLVNSIDIPDNHIKAYTIPDLKAAGPNSEEHIYTFITEHSNEDPNGDYSLIANVPSIVADRKLPSAPDLHTDYSLAKNVFPEVDDRAKMPVKAVNRLLQESGRNPQYFILEHEQAHLPLEEAAGKNDQYFVLETEENGTYSSKVLKQNDQSSILEKGDDPCTSGDAPRNNEQYFILKEQPKYVFMLPLDTEMSATELMLPAFDTEMPATELVLPALDTEMAATELMLPAFDTEMPATELMLPALDTEMAATELMLPAFDTEMPATELMLPALDTEMPATELILPALDTKMPATELMLPTLDIEMNLVNAQQTEYSCLHHTDTIKNNAVYARLSPNTHSVETGQDYS